MPHKTRGRTSSTISVALAALSIVLATGCSGSSADDEDRVSVEPSTSADPYEDLTVINPGRPGESASTGKPKEQETSGPEHADIAFMQMMVLHHAQAVQMSDLARTRADASAVRRLAARIRAAQGPEIVMMSSWLEDNDVAVPQPGDEPSDWDHSEHGHDPMMGMLTKAQLEQLAASTGRSFDRLFLAGMIRHHQGAVQMAETVTVKGTDVRVSELAADVTLTQNTEIARMQQLQQSLGS